jgi:ADP-ribose pyrophosphatase
MPSKKKTTAPAAEEKAKPATAEAEATTQKAATRAERAKATPTPKKRPAEARTSKPKAVRKAPGKAGKTAKPKARKATPGKKSTKPVTVPKPQTAQILSSEVVYQGPLFRILHDKLIEPDGKENERDVIRHNGSVVILALDHLKSKKDPWVVMERQYRHAANQYLWELPAGKLDAGEDALAGAKRELAEETGYSAKKWKPLVEYYASPGFLGESMKVYIAEGLVVGDAHPEEDEHIEIRLVKLSDVIKMIDKGMIMDGKTLTSVLLYARKLAGKRKK